MSRGDLGEPENFIKYPDKSSMKGNMAVIDQNLKPWYIETFYNRIRKHSYLRNRSPVQFMEMKNVA